MKKHLLFLILLALVINLNAQDKKPYAVDDTVYFSNGETLTINPLLNDYDPEGGELKIVELYGIDNVEYASFTDSTVTVKVADFYLGNPIKITYVLDFESFNPDGWGDIRLIPTKPQIDTLEVNQITTPVYPMNVQFFDAYYDMDGPQYFYPKDSKTSPIFSTALWIGGKSINNELHLAAETYRQRGTDFWPGPLSNDGNATTDSVNAGHWMRTWKISREEIISHIRDYSSPDYVMPEAIASWPAHGDPMLNQDEFIAPFVDVDQDLEYHPELGDYPFIKGDQTVFFIYNDQLEHTESEGLPLGLEVHCMAWGVNSSDSVSPYDGTVFYSYKIFNKSEEDYFDTYLGVYNDFDLGNPWDDLMGCNVENGNFFVYNGDVFDEDQGDNGDTTFGYHDNIPSQSICVLSGPFINEDGIDDPLGGCDESINGSGFGDGVVDNERFGMSRFSYLTNSWGNYNNDPQTAEEFYNYMDGYWTDGSRMVYGGKGHYQDGGDSTIPANFMYPGYSDPCNWGTGGIDPDIEWTEITAGNGPNDTRGVAIMGPYNFEAGSVEYLDIAIVTAPGTAIKASKELLQDYIAQIKLDYLVDPMKFGNQYVGIEEPRFSENLLRIYPNPVTGDQIQFELEIAAQAEYIIYNTAGQEVLSGQLPPQQKQSLNIGQLNAGWYILEIKTAERIYRSKLIK